MEQKDKGGKKKGQDAERECKTSVDGRQGHSDEFWARQGLKIRRKLLGQHVEVRTIF